MKILLKLSLLITILVLGACSSEGDSSATVSGESSPSTSTTLTWASGAQGGGWYTMAGGIGALIKEKEGINVSTIPGGSLQNMPFISTNEAQLAWMQPPFIQAGLEGTEPFEQKFENISIIGNGFGTNHFHLLVDASSPYETADELFKDVSKISIAVTPVNNSDEWVFKKVLDFYGLSYESIKDAGGKVIHGSYQEQADAIRNGNIKAIFSQLSIPSSTITEAAVSKDLKLLPFSDELVEHLKQFGLDSNVIPAGTYPDVANNSNDIKTFSMGNVLTVNSTLDEETVYKITKVINENVDQLVNIHASLVDYDPEKAPLNLTADLHPGAEKYYKEAGYIK